MNLEPPVDDSQKADARQSTELDATATSVNEYPKIPCQITLSAYGLDETLKDRLRSQSSICMYSFLSSNQQCEERLSSPLGGEKTVGFGRSGDFVSPDDPTIAVNMHEERSCPGSPKKAKRRKPG
ncbi:hypothetical protein Tco_0805448 [Tanacetum coccineum]